MNGCHDTHWLESSKGLKFEPLKSLTTKNRPGGWNLTPLEGFDCIWSSCQYLWIHCDHCCPAPKVLCRLSSLSSCLTYILFSTELRSINTKHMLSNDDDASISILEHLRWCQHQPKASMFMIVLSKAQDRFFRTYRSPYCSTATRHGLHLAEGCKIASLIVLWSLAEFQTPRPSAVWCSRSEETVSMLNQWN